MDRDALQILPEEVWKIVLDYLVTGKDMYNANNVCQVWKEVLKKHLFTWLFDKCVVHLTRYLPKNDLLNTRRVCKFWKESVDKYLSSEQLNIQYSSIFSHPAKYMPLVEMRLSEARQRYRQNTRKVLQRFHRNFNHHPSNSFVSRGVHVDIDGLGFGLVPFFEKFGQHIWYLTITIYQLFGYMDEINKLSSHVDIAKFLWNVLECTPNIKMLNLKIRQNLHDERTYNIAHCPMQIAKLKEFLESNRIPQLPNLRNLETNVDEHLCSIQEVLEKAYAPQLKYYTHYTDYYNAHNFDYTNGLANIEQFCWRINVRRLKILNPAMMDKLKAFPNVKKLCLDVETCHWLITDCYYACPTLVMQAIEKYTSKVTNLSIVWTTLLYDFPFKVNLPCLEKLTLRFEGAIYGKWSFSFLTFLPNLKHLQLEFALDYETFRQTDWRQYPSTPRQCSHSQENHSYNEEEHRIDILHCLDSIITFFEANSLNVSNVYKSNIWKRIRSLQKITVAIASYRGNGHYYQNQHLQFSKLVRVYGRKLTEIQ